MNTRDFNGFVNRRRFVAGAAALGTAVLASSSVAGQTPAASPTLVEAEPYVPQTGVEREEMIVGTYGIPAGIDPARNYSNVAFMVLHNVFDTLVRKDYQNGNAIVPMLAASWTSPEPTRHEFVLRDDVVFHDGTPMTAEDVAASFLRILNAAEDSPLIDLKPWIGTITNVEPLDDLTVAFTTAAPDPIFFDRLTLAPCYILSKAEIDARSEDEINEMALGTGPYKLTDFQPDIEISLERNEDYWGGPPAARRIVFRVTPELAGRLTALANDEVQIISNVTPDQVTSLEEMDNVEVRDVLIANAHMIRFNTNQPGLEDKRLRQALSLAIDRAAITELIWGGYAQHLRGLQLESFGSLYNPDRPLTPFDPEQARALVEESGYNNEPIYYQVVAGYYTNSEPTAQIVVEAWREIGVNAEVQISDISPTPEDAFALTWSNSDLWDDPASLPWRLWGEGTGIQRDFWSAPEEFNELGKEAESTLDEEVRFENYQRMLDIFEDECPGTHILQPSELFGCRSTVNWLPSPMQHMDFRNYNLSFNE